MLLTHSSIAAFKSCRRRYQYRYIDGLELMDRPVYFDFGSAIHLGLAMHYRGKPLTEVLQAVESYFQEHSPEPDDAKRVEDWMEAKDLAVGMLRGYVSHYAGRDKFKVVEIEKSFELPIHDIRGREYEGIRLAGKVDGIVEDGGLWVLEHKTTKTIDSRYERKLTLDAQSMIYLEAMDRVYGRRLNGVIYNVLVKSIPEMSKILKNGSLSKAKDQNTTPELYGMAISENGLNIADYADFLAYLEQNRKQYFFRERLAFSNDEREEWRRELWQIAADIERATEMGAFYRNTASCVGFGTCPYLDICSAPDKEFVIDNSYERKAIHSELEEATA
jgi:hypothetical protein